ncbi:helix-turn-helix transcriptional regulator [Actinomycetospora soli]|uniref:helix-turn-helix transcriptional regulator n=1 Tax=Actinomycetospora soli TaxID=2893887 RepID=UPI001E5F9172|nr:helix-turn-helix transcriptional regulator [Actinomycetospora soli]MCD2191384.1 helix-turn-helix transcriptional regulator [Actinomycetospora soli]
MPVVFDSADLDVVSAFVRDGYASARWSPRGERRGLRISQEQLSGLRLEQVTYRMRIDVDVEPMGGVYVGQALDGEVAYRDRRGERPYRKGDVFLVAQPDEAFHATVDDSDVRAAMIDPALLDEVAQIGPGERGVRLLAHEPVSVAAGAAWARVYASVASSVVDSPVLAGSPLVRAHTARLLAAVTLVTFPHTARVGPTPVDDHDAHPDTLRRAVAFIESHPDRPLGVADVAAAAFVTPRAVQLAFRRHLDTTPMGYLQKVRLDRAHRDLIAADPARTTVTEVATRWGFGHPSRFATSYRAAYGVPPSRTLRERR